MQQNPYGAPQGNMGAAAPAGGQLATGQHEFGPVEDQAMRKAGERTRRWGTISLVLGALTILASLGIGAFLLTAAGSASGSAIAAIAGGIAAVGASGLIQVSTGYFYIQSGSRLESVADTQGNDVEHLMQGLDKLANAMRIESIVTIVFTLLGFTVGIVAAGMS